VPDSLERDLPDFANPPVVETVLSVQFERLPALRSVHLGLFWERIRDRFPNTEDRPALAPVVERPVERVSQALQLRFEAQETLSLQRLWLLNSAGTEMIQLQNDRFIKNWRQSAENHQYPRYSPVIKPAFARDFGEFLTFLADEQLGDVRINQCEVTYVNHIVGGEGWSDWSEMDKVFTFWKQPLGMPYPGGAEDFGFRARFPILGPNKEWIGRLHVDVQPAVTVPDNKPMYAMNLTARGMCGRDFDFFDIGRRWVVKSFEDLTTPNMHRVWGKISK
jgi:uncharacterized protein (TIGR04255 family)